MAADEEMVVLASKQFTMATPRVHIQGYMVKAPYRLVLIDIGFHSHVLQSFYVGVF